MKLIPIGRDNYEEYRLDLMFDCYKWDPQFLDNNTIAKYALVLTEKEHEKLKELTERLDKETRTAEIFLNENQKLAKPLALPRSVKKEIRNMRNYEPDRHIRLMRYDFHPKAEGKWAVSEVNSDVPGGFAEASLMPAKALEFLGKYQKFNGIEKLSYINFGEIFVETLKKKLPQKSRLQDIRIMLVHCTCYSDDRQVMQFLGDRLKKEGYSVIYAAADHLSFLDAAHENCFAMAQRVSPSHCSAELDAAHENCFAMAQRVSPSHCSAKKEKKAVSILDGNYGVIDAIIRFTPLEWLTEIKPKRWQGYFDTETLSCNHPVAMYAQTKRFPLVWDVLEKNGISMSCWRELLPDTLEVKDARGKEGYIYKPACGRVGEKISIKEACSENEYKKILKDVKRHPKKYLAQKRFESMPLQGENGEEFHVCLGSYAVEGKHAGYYARISILPRIDSNAADIPVLIEREDIR